MQPFTTLTGIAAPLALINIDTDMIIPKQFLKTIKRTGLGKNLFDEMRFTPEGQEIPGFVLNQPAYRQASILVTGENFGCGSSREHAVWALRDYGFRAVLAPGFGDIFRQNCPLNGVAAITLAAQAVDQLFAAAAGQVLTAQIDVLQGRLSCGALTLPFSLSLREQALLTQDTDWIAATLAQRQRIAAFEHARLAAQPWLAHTLDS